MTTRPSGGSPGACSPIPCGKTCGSERQRRHLARISISEGDPESSIHIGASATRAAALVMPIQSRDSRNPERSFCDSTRASQHSTRSISDCFDISSENTSTGIPWSRAAFCAQFITNDVLPIDGRAAMMMRSPGCRPAVISSNAA